MEEGKVMKRPNIRLKETIDYHDYVDIDKL